MRFKHNPCKYIGTINNCLHGNRIQSSSRVMTLVNQLTERLDEMPEVGERLMERVGDYDDDVARDNLLEAIKAENFFEDENR